MVYLGKIARVKKSMRATVLYFEKESRTEASIHVAGLNAPADPSLFMTAMRGLNAHHQVAASRLDARATVFSFTREEVDPDDDQACADAFELVKRTAEQTWADRGFPVLLHGQRDGDEGLFHVHVLLPNVHLDTGRAMRGDDYSWERAAVVLDEQMQAVGMQHSHEAMRDRVQAIREHRPHRYQRSAHATVDVQAKKQGRQTFPERVALAMKDLEDQGKRPQSLDELDELLKPAGLTVRRRSKRLTYAEREGRDGKKPQAARQERVQLAAEQLFPPEVITHKARPKFNIPERTEERRRAPRVTAEELEGPAGAFAENRAAEQIAEQKRRRREEREAARRMERQQELAREREARQRREAWRQPSRPSYRPSSPPDRTKDTGPELG